MKEKWLPWEVEEVRQIVHGVFKKRNRIPVDDVVVFAKLWLEVERLLGDKMQDERLRKRFIAGLVEWSIFKKGGSLKRIANKVIDFAAVFEWDPWKESYVSEFEGEYKRYIRERWGIDVEELLDMDALYKAAYVAKRICTAEKITMFEYVKRQHECWEKITSPLSLEGLGDELKCWMRNKVYKDRKKRSGKLDKKEYQKGMIRRKWEQILRIGVENYVNSLKGHTDDFVDVVAKLFVNEKSDGVSEEVLIKKYSPEEVEKKWEILRRVRDV